MIAPQARGLEVPDAAGIPAFMEQIQRNLHLFGRYGITMFAISGLDIALWDLAAKRARACRCTPARRHASAPAIPAYASLLRIGSPDSCRRRMQDGARARLSAPSSCTRRRRRRCLRRAQAIGAGIPLMVDMNCPLDASRGDRLRAGHAGRRSRCSWRSRSGRRRILRRSPRCAARRARRRRRRECLHGISIPADDGCGRGQPRPAVGDQGRRHHGISEGCGARRSARRQDRSALPVFRPRPAGDACISWRGATTGSSRCFI